ncbi:hypothetical protein ACLB9X_34105 [Streptomyces sp. 5K101]|uniref:hypothetical protein n=1 Tax=Streptomyces sp. 5K101 TaxID=3390037 RepID=UPI0039768289
MNARTCWPKGLTRAQLEELLNGVVVQRYFDDKSGRLLTLREDLGEDDVVGGQQAPRCDLWKHGRRVHPEWEP